MATSAEEKILLGEAAEHLVLSSLLRRGYVASQAPRAWKADDILLGNGLRIQVKATVHGADKGWLVGNVLCDDKRYYAFVDFADESNAPIYVVPSRVVHSAAEAHHQKALELHPHAKDIAMRKIHDPFPFFRSYEDEYGPGWLLPYRWDKLGPL